MIQSRSNLKKIKISNQSNIKKPQVAHVKKSTYSKVTIETNMVYSLT